MKTFKVMYWEVEKKLVEATVSAEDEDDARAKAETGETETENVVVGHEEVLRREVCFNGVEVVEDE